MLAPARDGAAAESFTDDDEHDDDEEVDVDEVAVNRARRPKAPATALPFTPLTGFRAAAPDAAARAVAIISIAAPATIAYLT